MLNMGTTLIAISYKVMPPAVFQNRISQNRIYVNTLIDCIVFVWLITLSLSGQCWQFCKCNEFAPLAGS